MELTNGWAIFGWGCVGGILVELLRWYKLRESLEFPIFAKKWTYWVLTVLMILAGGLLAYAHSTTLEKGTIILAMNLGASAPALIGAGFAKPKGGGPADELNFGGSGATLGRLRRFLAFGR